MVSSTYGKTATASLLYITVYGVEFWCQVKWSLLIECKAVGNERLYVKMYLLQPCRLQQLLPSLLQAMPYPASPGGSAVVS